MTTPSIATEPVPVHRLPWAWLTLVSHQHIDQRALDAGHLDSWRRIGIEVDARAWRGDLDAARLYLNRAGTAIAYHLRWRLVPDFDGEAERVARAAQPTVAWVVARLE